MNDVSQAVRLERMRNISRALGLAVQSGFVMSSVKEHRGSKGQSREAVIAQGLLPILPGNIEIV